MVKDDLEWDEWECLTIVTRHNLTLFDAFLWRENEQQLGDDHLIL